MDERSVRGKRSQRRGKEFERALAKLLRPLWPNAARGLRQTRKGSECCDVEGTPFWVEAKHHNRVDRAAAYRQAEADADGRTPVVIWRETGARTIWVTMSAADLVRIANRYGPAIAPVAEGVLVTLRLEDWMAIARETRR